MSHAWKGGEDFTRQVLGRSKKAFQQQVVSFSFSMVPVNIKMSEVFAFIVENYFDFPFNTLKMFWGTRVA